MLKAEAHLAPHPVHMENFTASLDKHLQIKYLDVKIY